MSKIISSEDLGGLPSAPCISAAQKFILPIPLAEGDPLVFPEGHPKAGQPVADYEGKPIGGRGLVFYNGVDKVVQAVRSDGEGIVIINEVTAKGAAALGAAVEFFGGDPFKMSLGQIKAVLDIARVLGYVDQYNSNKAFMAAKMTPINHGAAYGAFKRDDRDLCAAFLMEEPGFFQGPAAEPQAFVAGDVVVKQVNPKGGFIFAKVDAEVFSRTYSSPAGGPVEFPGR